METIKTIVSSGSISKEVYISNLKENLSAYLISNTPLPQLKGISNRINSNSEKAFTTAHNLSKTETYLINTMPLPQLK